ncbi:hypothetical protein DRF65_25785 [Chryseobacterium pennae]|uniref:Uncharacterized protein n=1 Tax=Chryseobacterium pennae TaxID=2258962 RepID=A0A3D9C1T5_9FLAO|nr:hypothetical protein [Chryseobacterium pennae]REC59496.1 hypothetical protein DRF65_25785 [Chryseobacterium pennae]
MEDTVDSRFYDRSKGQIFRITYKNRDFQVKLLQKEITKEMVEIDLLLDGVVQKLVKRDSKWFFEHSEVDKDFANDIWRAISLRYRL